MLLCALTRTYVRNARLHTKTCALSCTRPLRFLRSPGEGRASSNKAKAPMRPCSQPRASQPRPNSLSDGCQHRRGEQRCCNGHGSIHESWHGAAWRQQQQWQRLRAPRRSSPASARPGASHDRACCCRGSCCCRGCECWYSGSGGGGGGAGEAKAHSLAPAEQPAAQSGGGGSSRGGITKRRKPYQLNGRTVPSSSNTLPVSCPVLRHGSRPREPTRTAY